MNHRERVKIALSHREPDRLPIDIGGTFLSTAPEQMQKRIADILGLSGKPDPRFRNFDDRIQKYFDTDLRSIIPRKWPYWGFTEQHEAPFRHASIDDLEKFPWPVPEESMVEDLQEEAAFLHEKTDYFICASQIGQGILEHGCYLRGYEQILLDYATNEKFVHAFNKKLLEINIRLGDFYFRTIGKYVDMVMVGDDIATQNGPYMSPEMFKRLVKPYFKEYIASIKKYCPNAFIAHHSCGSSYILMDDLAQIGIDVINPTQTTAKNMGPENLATRKDKLSFHGGVDLQYILPYGTRDEVENFVKNLISKLGKNGGYILAACHSLPEDVKPENVIIMMETAKKYGQYPTKI